MPVRSLLASVAVACLASAAVASDNFGLITLQQTAPSSTSGWRLYGTTGVGIYTAPAVSQFTIDARGADGSIRSFSNVRVTATGQLGPASNAFLPLNAAAQSAVFTLEDASISPPQTILTINADTTLAFAPASDISKPWPLRLSANSATASVTIGPALADILPPGSARLRSFRADHDGTAAGASVVGSTLDFIRYRMVMLAVFEYTFDCPADFDGSGTVDDADFVMFAQAYDQYTCPRYCRADFNNDGVVDDLDFVLFTQAYDALNCPNS